MHDSSLLDLWRQRARDWLCQSPAEALARFALIDALLESSAHLSLWGDERSLLLCRTDQLISKVVFLADDPRLLWSGLQQTVGVGRLASALVDDQGRALLGRLALIEAERPRLLMTLAHPNLLLPADAQPLTSRDHPALRELLRSVQVFGLMPDLQGDWFGLWSGRQLVAAGSINRRWPGLGEICDIVTHPQFRRQGHASLVISTIAKLLLDANYLPFLEVIPENEPAIACYKRLGFVVRQRLWKIQFMLRPWDTVSVDR